MKFCVLELDLKMRVSGFNYMLIMVLHFINTQGHSSFLKWNQNFANIRIKII